ncbi:MAG: glycosyltransferase, partial [Patescibacteria group bacterium]|nr:glycosyltransferase [Patescibacteria group bacterium]
MKILLAGGGTLGSVNPLIAIYEEAKKQGKTWDWFWVGTRKGIERAAVAEAGIAYEWMPVVKLRRYFSLRIFIDPFLFVFVFFRSLLMVMTEKPDIIIGAGSYVSVPLVGAAWLLGKKTIIHQQDIRPTLSNTLCSRAADKITVSFKKSLEDFPREKTEWIGNPVRDAAVEADPAAGRKRFGLSAKAPVLLVTGGSSGAAALNKWVWDNLEVLAEGMQIIHLTGRGNKDESHTHPQYRQIEFLGEHMHDALAAADVVVVRGGISTLTELAYLAKAAVIIPMPPTHQEDNAFYALAGHAAAAFQQEHLSGDTITRRVLELAHSKEEREALGSALHGMLKKGSRERM